MMTPTFEDVFTGVKRTSVSPPPSFPPNKRLKKDLISAEQMTTVVTEMKEYSSTEMWELRMDKAKVDESTWKPLMASIWNGLASVLVNTDVRDKFIAPQTLSRTKEIVNSFSDEDYKEWKKGVQKGVADGDWKDLVEHPKLRAETISPKDSQLSARGYTRPGEDQGAATEKSWEYPFQGDAATGLWEHIHTHYNPSNDKIYAHSSAIVQSSGMGKSRAVDELAKDHFVIFLNLRDAKSTGYPPADHVVRDYLTAATSRDGAYNRACAFLEALFKHSTEVLRDFDSSLDYKGIAKEFRVKMTEGQKTTGHNEFRKAFYSQVIQQASQLVKRAKSATTSQRKAPDNSARPSPSHVNEDFPPYKAFEQLQRVLQRSCNESPTPSPTRRGGKTKPSSKDAPIVVLAADEAHTISQRRQTADGEYSVITQIASATDEDPSSRVIQGILAVIEPFTDLGFDHLAATSRVSLNGSWNLEKLTADSHICSLGRPLFGARYQEGNDSVKREIIQFARAKLLNASDVTPYSTDQELACLSQRIPIEFNSTNYIDQEKERKQVEGHMRVCLKIDTTSQTMTSTSSSEPILSEAAYFVMQGGLFNSPKALMSVMEGFSVSKGDRGQFLVLLLLILARDATVGRADDYGRPITGKRWFGLSGFLYGQIFREQAVSSTIVDDNSIQALRTLQQDFPRAYLHFSHFVKVHEYGAIDITSLLLLQSRGAAVLCTNNQAGLDAVNVFLRDGTGLTRNNAGLILEQVKNDAKFTDTPRDDLFDAMDPYKLGILDIGEKAVPVIKIVFALAAEQPSLHVVRHAPTPNYNAVVYEIWCAGLSHKLLRPIDSKQAVTWRALLQASYGWKDLYKCRSNVTGDLRRSETPGAARHSGHYSRWAIR